MRWRPGRRKRGERGQSVVEFGLILMTFMMLILGLLDLGFAVLNYNTLSQATREGTRYAIVHGAASSDPSGPGTVHFTEPNSDENVTQAVESHAGGVDLARLTVESEWLDGTNEVGSRVRVTSRYTYEPIFDFLGITSFDLSSSSTMEITH